MGKPSFTEIHARFVEVYAVHGEEWGPRKCAEAAGQKKSPSNWAHDQLAKPSMKKRIAKRRAEIEAEAQKARVEALEQQEAVAANVELLPPIERLRLDMNIRLLDGASLIALRSNLAQASMADWTDVVYERDENGKILERDGQPVYRLLVRPEKGLLLGLGHHVKRLRATKHGWDITLIDSTQERNALGRYLGIDSKDDKWGHRQGTDAAERRARVAAALKKLSVEQRRMFYAALLREGRTDDELAESPA